MKKQRKGITLIALVITIIILLILAGITINLTVGQKGIITRAQEAGRNYQEAAKREDEELANLWAEAEDILKGNGSGGGTIPTPPDGGDDKDPVTPTEPSEEVKALKAGDYIKYDTGVTTVGENGVITCRVLYPVDSEYGLQIISNKNVGPNVKLGGSTWEEAKTSYNGAIETLNSEAEKYVNTAYAYDGRCVGSIPTVQNGMFVNKNRVIDSEGKIQDTLNTLVLPPSTWTSYKRPNGWEDDDTGCYDQDTNYTIDKEALEGANIWKTWEVYWLASRYNFSNGTDWDVRVRYVDKDNNGTLRGNYVCSASPYGGTAKGSSYENGLRPCISLKASTIKITGGDGKGESSAYTLGI